MENSEAMKDERGRKMQLTLNLLTFHHSFYVRKEIEKIRRKFFLKRKPNWDRYRRKKHVRDVASSGNSTLAWWVGRRNGNISTESCFRSTWEHRFLLFTNFVCFSSIPGQRQLLMIPVFPSLPPHHEESSCFVSYVNCYIKCNLWMKEKNEPQNDDPHNFIRIFINTSTSTSFLYVPLTFCYFQSKIYFMGKWA